MADMTLMDPVSGRESTPVRQPGEAGFWPLVTPELTRPTQR
jgi:hypothetical protein